MGQEDVEIKPDHLNNCFIITTDLTMMCNLASYSIPQHTVELSFLTKFNIYAIWMEIVFLSMGGLPFKHRKVDLLKLRILTQQIIQL